MFHLVDMFIVNLSKSPKIQVNNDQNYIGSDDANITRAFQASRESRLDFSL